MRYIVQVLAVLVFVVLFFVVLSFMAAVTRAQDVAVVRGHMRVVDGDTLALDRARIRLYGIDAPEIDQTCDQGHWPAGLVSKSVLESMISGGEEVSCFVRGTDRYGRMIAVCLLGTADLGQEMVRFGEAWAYEFYSRSYVGEQDEAKKNHIGVWRHECQYPREYRAEKRRSTKSK